MATHQNFVEATRLFYQNQYLKGLEQLNVCIQANPQNAMLFSNRSLFYSQMGHLPKAMLDLEKSIQLDHLNYVSYFNLFSLLYRTDKIKEGLMNLCCSLSCLYLTRARYRKRQLDAQKSIRYAQNNIQAHVLKGLMHLQNNRIKLALNELDWAYEIEKNNETLNKIRKILYKKSNISCQEDTDTSISRSASKRLMSSYQPQQQDLTIEIKMKISQFNDIYNDLNEEQGTLTQRVPRTLLPNQIQQMVKLNLQQPISQIYELKYKQGTNQPIVYQMKQEYRKQKDLQHSEDLLQEHQIFLLNQGFQNQFQQDDKIQKGDKMQDYGQQQIDNGLIDNSQKDRDFSAQIDQIEQKNTAQQKKQPEIQNKLAEKGEKIIQGQNYNQSENQNEQDSYQDYLVVEEYPSNIQINENNNFLYVNNSEKLNQIQVYKNEQIPSNSNQNQSADYSVSQISSRQGVPPICLYPMKSRTLGRFKVIRFDILQANYHKKLQQMYCKLTYTNSSSKQQHLLTTCDSLFLYDVGSCEWNEVFREIQLADTPSNLKSQIYSKNCESYKDDFFGKGQICIQNSGEMRVNILNNKKIIGYLNFKLYII